MKILFVGPFPPSKDGTVKYTQTISWSPWWPTPDDATMISIMQRATPVTPASAAAITGRV